ncbi:MAG: hypothetical protein KAY37_17120, partial [Phycisphaerae bacterium]|nr:hypothetical protein [Phycisphaerae bacterium]
AGTEPDRYTSVGGHWIAPPPSVPGIVYADNQPGLLRLELPSGGVTVAAAKTATGGPVEFRYADDVRTVNMHASPNEAFTVHLKRRSVPPDQSLWVRRPLPNYPLQRLRLSWYDSPGAHFTLSNVKLQETLFGRRIRARSITPLVHQGVVETGHEGKTFRFEASSAAGAVLFPIPIKLGSRINAVGYGLTLVVLLMLVFGGPLLWQLVRRIPRPVRSFEAVALGLVVVAHVWMAAWSPLVFVPDSLDYVHSSMVFWETWSLDHIHPGRVPGFTVFIAPFVAGFQDFGAALGWVHAALGILGAWLARGMVKPFAPRPWPGVALLVVGLNPLALMYERIMLSECLASFCALLAAWMIVRLTAWNTAGRLSWRTGLLMAAGIGLVGGLAPYVRGNLQIVVALGPLVLLLSSCRRPRRLQVLVQAVTVGVVGVACLAPWIARNARYCGRAEFIIGKHYQRLEEGSQLGCQFTDDNQTLAFDYDHWQQIRERLQTQQRYALPAELYHSRLRPEPLPDRYHAVQREKMCRPIIDETVARQPLRTLLNMAAALATQLGLWNKFPQSRAENAYWSLPLRGVVRTTWANTNFIADTDMLSVTGPADAWKADLAQRVRHDISYVVESPHARLYNEWFWAYRFLAPVMAILFLIGLGLSLWHGRYAMFGVGLFPLANAAALAILIISNVERYSMPFNGLMLVVAVYGVYLLTQRRTAAPTAG